MRRERIDGVQAALEVAASAGRVIEPPSNVPLTDEQVPFFASIIDETPISDWTPHTLELAALMARTMQQLEYETRAFALEDSVMFTEKGTAVANPRKSIIQMLTGSILSMRRSLAIHARGQGGEKRDTDKRRNQASAIESALGHDGDDGLLA